MSQAYVGQNSNSSSGIINSSNNTSSFNTINSFNNTTNKTVSFSHVSSVNNYGSAEEERTKILAWLSPLEPRIRHHYISTHRVGHVGDWLLQTEKYWNWFSGIPGGWPNNSALFCYGAPGVGKTYISSLVVDRLGDWIGGQNAAVTCFYFDFVAQKEQSPTSVLSSLLRQVVGGLGNVPGKIVQAFRDQEGIVGGRKPGLSQIIDMVSDISSSRPTFICIDGLDECLAEYRGVLLDSLKQILHKSPSARLFLTGRSHIWNEVEKHLGGRVLAVSITPTRDDIIRFLRAMLGKDTTPDAMDESLEKDIIEIIPEMASEIFLLASLNIEAIIQETTLYRRREKLGAMRNGLGLGDAYGVTIGRIRAQEGDRARLGMATLMWISHSERPLRTDEICHALAVEIGSTGINPNNVPSIGTVLSCCQGLTAVDEGSSTIRLIHLTLKEYLSRHGDLFNEPHSRIAETCLTYLNFRSIRDLPASPSHGSRAIPFLEYSSLHWGTHMRVGLSDRAKDLALDFLFRYDNHISAGLLWRSTAERCFSSFEPFSALHCISYLGISEVATDLIRTKTWDVNHRDCTGQTPLMWAARYGREEVVKLLLQQKHIQPDMRDTQYDRTALSWAALSGHGRVVQLFLSPQFVNHRGIGGRWGKALFGRKYVDPDRPDNGGQTPLSWAACNGHDGVVKLLLEREEVTPDRPGGDGRTPLSWAAWNGHDGVVKLLLERQEVSPDTPDSSGQTPLSWAARGGRAGPVRILLERGDVNPNRPDMYGLAPLSWAAWCGHDIVLKLLLRRGDINPNTRSGDGRTPLSLAAGCWHGGVVRLLLERSDVNPNIQDNNGRTPLSWAAGNGCDGTVELLLGRADVTPDIPEIYDQTPLLLAIRGGHDGVAKLLLKRGDVNPELINRHRQTPIFLAEWYGRGEVVKLLRARRAAAPPSTNLWIYGHPWHHRA